MSGDGPEDDGGEDEPSDLDGRLQGLLPDGRKRPLSGARRRRLAKLEADAGLDDEVGGGELYDSLASELEAAEADPATALAVVRKAMLRAFRQIATSRTISNRERWRLMKEYAAVLGMTSNRSELEERTRKLEAMLRDARKHGSVKFESGVARPDTARGRRPPGPRPTPEGPADAGPEPDTE